MRQKNETSTSFNQLKEITQIMQTLKRSGQTSDNANISEIASQSALKPKTVRTKNHALKPTKRAFSDRQILPRLENSQVNVIKALKLKKATTQTPLKAMKRTQGGKNEAY
ncbi:hypothetical protein UBN10_09810 [Helicobacter pylori]